MINIGDRVNYYSFCRPYAILQGEVLEVRDDYVRLRGDDGVVRIRFHLARRITHGQNVHDGYWQEGENVKVTP